MLSPPLPESQTPAGILDDWQLPGHVSRSEAESGSRLPAVRRGIQQPHRASSRTSHSPCLQSRGVHTPSAAAP